MIEPKGCPTPGACSAAAQIAALEKERDHWREAYFKTMSASDSIIKAMSAADSIIEIERQRVRDALENSARLIEERNQLAHEFGAEHRLYLTCKHDLADAQARIARLRGELTHINDYWNGSRNDRAMWDALTHIDDVVTKALATPSDTSALDARLEQERERVALQFNSGSLHNLAVQEKIRSMK